MKGLVLIVLALTFVSCSKDQVNDAKGVFVASVSSAGSSAISTALECSGVDAIKADLSAKLSSAVKYENSSQDKSLAGSVCVVAIQAVMPELIGQGLDQVPAAWGCKATKLSASLQEFATGLCAKL